MGLTKSCTNPNNTYQTPTPQHRYAHKTLTFCIMDGVFNALAIHDYGASGVPSVWLLVGCFIVVIKVSLAILLALPQTRRNAGNVVLMDVATDLWFVVFPVLYALIEIPDVESSYTTFLSTKTDENIGESWIGRKRDKEEPTDMQSGNGRCGGVALNDWPK